MDVADEDTLPIVPGEFLPAPASTGHGAAAESFGSREKESITFPVIVGNGSELSIPVDLDKTVFMKNPQAFDDLDIGCVFNRGMHCLPILVEPERGTRRSGHPIQDEIQEGQFDAICPEQHPSIVGDQICAQVRCAVDLMMVQFSVLLPFRLAVAPIQMGSLPSSANRPT